MLGGERESSGIFRNVYHRETSKIKLQNAPSGVLSQDAVWQRYTGLSRAEEILCPRLPQVCACLTGEEQTDAKTRTEARYTHEKWTSKK